MDRNRAKISFCRAFRRHPWWLRGVALFGAGSLVTGLVTREASACSIQGRIDIVGSPADGDANVPTDVVPYYTIVPGGRGLPNVSIYPADSWSEVDSIATTFQHTYGDTFELVLERTLEPNTEYRLEDYCSVVQLFFTTGDGPSDGSPERPDASLVHYRFAEQTGDGPSPVGTCVAFEPQGPVVVTSIDALGEEHGPELRERSYFTNLSGIEQEPAFVCERLQSRAPNGTLSEPVELCREDGPLYTLGPDEDVECTPAGLTRGGVLVTEDTNIEPDGEGGAGGDDAAAPSASPDDETSTESCSLPSGPQRRSTGLFALGLLPFAWVARATRRRRLPTPKE